MDTIDRSHTNLPARFPAALSPLRDLSPGLPTDQAATPGLQINARVILRGLTRHWWLILVLWLVVSAPIVFLVHLYIQPTYEAASLLRVDPAQQELFGPINRVENANSTYLQTQASLITSDKVLDPAVADALVVNLPTIKKSQDPKSDLRAKLRVWILDNTNLIRVAMELPDADEAVTIVKAVVQSYITQNVDYSRGANRELMESLKNQLEKLGKEIKEEKVGTEGIVQEGPRRVSSAEERLTNAKDDGSTTQPTFKNFSENHIER